MEETKVDKKVDNHSIISKSQAEVLQGLAKFLNITEIAKHRKCSRQAIYKVLKSLLKKGLIEKIGYAYGLTEKGRQGLHSFMGLSSKLRQHNLAFKFEVLDSQKNWDKKRSMLVSLPYFSRKVDLRNTSYELLNFGRAKVKTTSRSVIFVLPAIYSSDVDSALVEAIDMLYALVPQIEGVFKVKLIKDRKANIKIISQEYARLEDSVARLYRKEDNKLYVRDENGEVWLIADYSFSVDELETVSPNRADEDMDAVHPFLNDLRKNPTTFSELKDIIIGVTHNQGIFDANMKSHLEVLDKIGKAVDELRKEIKRLGDGKNGL